MSNEPPPAQQPPPPAESTGFDVAAIREQLARGARIQPNLGQDVLVVTANEARLRLFEFERTVKARNGWQGPAALMLGCLANLLTLKSASSFEALFGLNRDQWIGANIGAVILLGTLTALRLVDAVRARAGLTVERVVESLREPTVPPQRQG